MMAELCNSSSNNKSINANSGTHDFISQDADDADIMEFYSDKEATIAASNVSSSEYGGTQNLMPYEFEEGVNDILALVKELNVQAVKKFKVCSYF